MFPYRVASITSSRIGRVEADAMPNFLLDAIHARLKHLIPPPNRPAIIHANIYDQHGSADTSVFRGLPFHQDTAYGAAFTNDSHPILQMWICLDTDSPSGVENALYTIGESGSSAFGVDLHRTNGSAKSYFSATSTGVSSMKALWYNETFELVAKQGSGIPGLLAKAAAKFITLPFWTKTTRVGPQELIKYAHLHKLRPGDALIFDNRVIHASAKPVNSFRRGLALRLYVEGLNQIDTRYIKWHKALTGDLLAFGIGGPSNEFSGDLLNFLSPEDQAFFK